MCNYKIFSIAPTEQKKKWRFKKTRRRELEIRKRTIIQEAAQEAVKHRTVHQELVEDTCALGSDKE